MALSRLAAGQHGVVTLAQLTALGLSASGVRDRVGSGRLHRVHRGVYAVGHPLLSGHGRWMAAVLAYGPEAVLSHRSSAALVGLRPDTRAIADISLPRSSAHSRPGIEAHGSTTLRAQDVTVRDGIRCTTVARTLLDLADVLDRRGVERAVEQAEALRLFDGQALDEVLARANGRRGAGVLRALLREPEGAALTASELEERFLALCRDFGVAKPEVNAWIARDDGWIKADFLWRAERLVVETDGHAHHGTRQAFERDRRRDQDLLLGGWQVIRFTWRQVSAEPEGVAGTIRSLLARRTGR